MYEPSELAEEMDESLYNDKLDDEDIVEAVWTSDGHFKNPGSTYVEGERMKDRNDVDSVDIERVRHHLKILEAENKRYWKEFAENHGTLSDPSGDDYLAFRASDQFASVEGAMRRVEDDVDVLALAFALDTVASAVSGYGASGTIDYVVPLPDDVTLEDVEEIWEATP